MKMPKPGTKQWHELKDYQYKRMLEERKGHNYEWFNQEKWDKMEEKGWCMHVFDDKFYGNVQYTGSELEAKEVVGEYRQKGWKSRIICGYHQIKQKVKYYTVIYRSTDG